MWTSFIQKDSIQEVKFRFEGVMFWLDTRSCAETGRPWSHVRWRRNKSFSLNSRDKRWSPHPTHPKLSSKKDKQLLNSSVFSMLLNVPTCQLHLLAPQLEILTRSCDVVQAPSHEILVSQSQFLPLLITKQRGSLRTREVTFHFYENSSFLNTAINNRQHASTLTKPRIQQFIDRWS